MIKNEVFTHFKKIGYNVYYVGLYGSQNYNLNTEKSDYDFKAIVIPTLDDLISNYRPTSMTLKHKWNGQIDIKDIRLMIDQWKKGAVNFLEILFTDDYFIRPEYPLVSEYFVELRDRAEEIVMVNPYNTLKAMHGMMKEKYHALDYEYPCQAKEVREKGYCAKQLHHLIRLGAMMKHFGTVPFGSLINPFKVSDTNEDLKKEFEFALKIKTREIEYNAHDAKLLGLNYITETAPLLNNVSNKTNQDIVDFLEDMKTCIIKEAITRDLEEVIRNFL